MKSIWAPVWKMNWRRMRQSGGLPIELDTYGKENVHLFIQDKGEQGAWRSVCKIQFCDPYFTDEDTRLREVKFISHNHPVCQIESQK